MDPSNKPNQHVVCACALGRVIDLSELCH